MKIEITEAERDAILAGLRLLQGGGYSDEIDDIRTNGGQHAWIDVDALCERINVGPEPQTLSECCHALVDSNNELCGGPFQASICTKCGDESPRVLGNEGICEPDVPDEGDGTHSFNENGVCMNCGIKDKRG